MKAAFVTSAMVCPPRAVGPTAIDHPTCKLRDVRHRGFTRVGLLAGLGRVERGVLLAAQRLARELDQVVRGEAHAEHRLDLPFLERELRRLPECAAIVRLPAALGCYVPAQRRAERQPGQV